MPKIYCSDCGSPMEYTVSKPKFCSNCGHQLTQTSPSSAGQKLKINDISLEEDFADSDLDLKDIELNEKDIEYNYDRARSFKMKDIMGTGSEEKKSRNSKLNRDFNSLNSDEVLRQFSEEAGAVRPKNAKKEEK